MYLQNIIIELMPEYECITVDTKEKLERLSPVPQERKIYLFDFRKNSGGTQMEGSWEDIYMFDKIKFKIFLYDENYTVIPKTIITNSDLSILTDIKDYMKMFFLMYHSI